MKRMQRVFGDLDALRFVDGRLDDDRKSAFLAHLADDPVEAERVAIWARQNETIRAAFAGVALESMPPALRLSSVTLPRGASHPSSDETGTTASVRPLPIRATETRRAASAGTTPVAYIARPSSMASRTGRVLRLPLSAALLFGLAMLIVYVAHGLLVQPSAWQDDRPMRRVAETVTTVASRAADAYSTYAVDAVRPVEFSAAQDRDLARWIKRRVGVAIEPVDLAPEGWTLLGGRLVPALDGPGALFVYENRAGDRLGLLVARAAPFASATADLSSAGPGVAVMTWSVGSFTYAIATGRSADWLSRNGESLRERIGR